MIGTGTILNDFLTNVSITELEKVLKRYGEPLTYKQSRSLLQLMDKDENGKVDINGKCMRVFLIKNI